MLDGNIVGNPESPITWTTLSTREISRRLKAKGFNISHVTVAKRLDAMDFSLQQNKKYM